MHPNYPSAYQHFLLSFLLEKKLQVLPILKSSKMCEKYKEY